MVDVARRIGELLVEEGACAPTAVREALQAQVIFGGRLGTNLLEHGAVTEETLARALGRRRGCPFHAGPVRPEREALRAVPAVLADRWELVPVRLEGRRLTALACDPTDLAMLDEVAFATDKEVAPVLAAEARIWALLRGAYGLVRQLRGVELDVEPGAGRIPTPTRAAADAAAPAADLMDEAEFEELYGGLAAAATRGGESQPADGGDDGVIDLVEELEPEPLAFDQAVGALRGAAGRDAIAQVVLRYARSRLRRAVLFTVHRGAVQGWAGLGEALAGRDVGAIRLRLGTPGVLDTVVRTRAHFLGPLPRTEANVRMLKALGGGVPANALLVPILALGRVVNVLYADGGRGELVDADGVGELLILATRIAQSYEALAARV
ncbi:MAG TPA: hypothetical protein VMU15_14380 [Anaeromyxobacter sp.]|nr:hypothetical protein [Anaeromyxobacter sp.]